MKALARFALIPLVVLFCEPSPGFDAPDWDDLFLDIDAVHLRQDDREMLVAALSGLAANFFDSPLVDEDLREKAMFLALKINPLDASARNIYRGLVRQEKPPATSSFKTSVSEISETLWRAGEKLKKGKASEPEGGKLALYLQELSLVIDPSPELDRIGALVKALGDSPLKWKGLALQPADCPSSSRLKKLAAEWRKASARSVAPIPDSPPIKPATPPPTLASETPSPKTVPVQPPAVAIAARECSLPFALTVSGFSRTVHLPGTVSLLVRSPEPEDIGLFGLEPEADFEKLPKNWEMKLTGTRAGMQIEGLEKAEALLRKLHPDWPRREVAQFRFHPASGPSSPPRFLEGDFSLAASLLLENAFSGKPVSEKMMFIGSLAEVPESGGSVRFSAGQDFAESIFAVHEMEENRPDFLVLPGDQQAEMLASLVASRDLKYLFDPQLIAFSTWDELKAAAFGADREALLSASGEWKAIQAVQDKMSLIDLSRNEKVRERLDKILSIYPRHLSARLMLDFGKTPDDPKAIIRQAVRETDEVMVPLFEHFHTWARQVNRGEEPDTSGVETTTKEIDKTLADRSSSGIPAIKPYIFQSRELIKKVEIFAGTSNKTSAVGQQRVQDIKDSLEKLNAEREKLGVTKITFEESDDEMNEAFPRRKFRPPFLR